MQAPEKVGAATQRYAGGDPKFERLGGVLGTENTQSTVSIQDLRARYVARRFRLPPAIAAAVAEIAFHVEAAR